ncbi:UNVERIFIED_CONTAM: hypothetical protein Cloal_0905 [Acetivibrio alkalicellulosi]
MMGKKVVSLMAVLALLLMGLVSNQVVVADSGEDQYLVGDWNGDGKSNLAVRRGTAIYMDTNFDGDHDILLRYGKGNNEDEYLVGDWNGDGRDNIAVRRGNKIYMDTDFDGEHDILQVYGKGNKEDQYLVGDWNGDGRDNIAVRRGDKIYMDTNFDGEHNILQVYGKGNKEDQYLVGDWNGDGRDNIAVRRGDKIYMDTNFDGEHNILQVYGKGNKEDQYLVGDWNGDGRDNIAVRRGNKIYMDTNFDGAHNILQVYGKNPPKPTEEPKTVKNPPKPTSAPVAFTPKVVTFAESKVGTSYANGYCLRFVRQCFEHCYGFYSSACCANKYGNSYVRSSSKNNIPLGADVFFYGSSITCSTCKNKCGHVGIYVGNGYIVHGWNGKIVKTTIDYVVSRGYPYRGWGYHGNVVLKN